MLRWTLACAVTGALASFAVAQTPRPKEPEPAAPNVVLILLDDAGYANASTFGGPAQTPALDRLAAEGLRYNRFHVSSICSATRAALLSGRNDHRVGFGLTPEMGSDDPGYTGQWPRSAASLAEVLRLNGYSTSAFGKWHNTPEYEINPFGPFDRWPTHLGFEYFYGFMGGAYSQWEPPLYENTTPVDAPRTAEQGYHFTGDIADQAIRWVRTHQALAPKKPYFLYFATGATHFPLHVPGDWIAAYRGKFDQGWDKMREEIFVRQKRLGVIPEDAELTPRPAELPAWDSLTVDQRKLLARQMEVQAAFTAHTDREIGRMIQAVRESPGGENTIILYVTGDNGADLENGIEGRDVPGTLAVRLQHLDELGGPKSLNALSSGWGWATNTPFQWGKFIASHLGGIRNGLVVSWPRHIKNPGGVRSQFTHVTDIAATVYELAGIAPPATVDGIEQMSVDGISFAYSFDEPAAPSRRRTQIFEQRGNRAIYQDGWMASARHMVPWIYTNRNRDYENDQWELYHLDEDYSQARNVAAKFPEKLKELRALFEAEAASNNIYPLGPAPTRQAARFTAGRKEFIYPGDLPRMSAWAAPKFDRTHRITAQILVPEGGAEGVILSHGSRWAGFALYVKDNHLVYENNATVFGGQRDLIRSPQALPTGRIEVAYEFVRDEAASPKGRVSGAGRLYINQQLAGESGPLTLPPSGLMEFLGTFNLGQARVSPVSIHFPMPFKFTGSLEKVTVQLK